MNNIVRKSIGTIIFLCLGLLLFMTPVRAAENFVFDGDSKSFVTDISGSAVGGFTNMEPGASQDLTLTLTNSSSNTMNFYMDAVILDNIAEKGEGQYEKNGVYDFTIAKNGTQFFHAVITGNETNIPVGKEYLTEDNKILLDTMEPNQTDSVTITISLDGDSMENVYMDQAGVIQLEFSAGTPTTNSAKTVFQKVYQKLTGNTAPQTGIDSTDMILLAVLVCMVAAVIILVVLKKRRDKEENTKGENIR